MEKLKLVDGQTFNLVPMGISTNNFDKVRQYSFVSDALSYEDIESAFANNGNINRIEYYSASDTLLKVYEDCVALKSVTKEFNKQIEDGIFGDIYIVTLSII